MGALRAYLETLLPVVLPVSEDAVHTCLGSAAALEALAALAHEAGVPCLFVDELVPVDGATEAPMAISLAYRPTWTSERASVLALVKRQAVLDLKAPLPAQLRVVSLQGAQFARSSDDDSVLLETPYEVLETVVHSVMTPWLEAYAQGHETTHDEDGRAGGPLVRRKLAELEASLRQVQQDVEIPQVVLRVHPAIEAAIERGVSGLDAIQPPELLQDDAFINQLHADMNGWVRAVQTVTKLDRDPATGTALQELRFWVALEGALESLEHQLHAPAITLTLDVLTHAKRFHATVSFLADTGLKDCLERVRGYHVLLKDLPLDALLTASTLDALRDAQEGVLVLLPKKLRVSAYPVRRALALMDAVGRDARETLLRLLAGNTLMRLDSSAFAAQTAAAEELMDAWDELSKEFVYVARDLIRKRADKLIPIKASAPYTALRARLAYLQRLRRAHDELVDMAHVGETGGAASDAVQAIRAAWESFYHINVLDVSEQGQAALGASEAQYNERVAQVESRLIERLQHGLGRARTARERLRILAQYNRLFVRPRVRAAVQEHQTVLLQSVRADLDTLRSRFQAGYRDSDAHMAGQLRHQPDMVGAIVWLGEMERQLRVYRQRVEAALGADWVDHVEGQRLWAESEAFLQQLDARPLVQAWTQEMGRRAVMPRGGVLRIVNTPTGTPQLRAHFEAHALALADEAHALTMLGLTIPQALASTAHDVRRIAPYALAIESALHTWDKVRAESAARPTTAPLLARAVQQVRECVQQVASCRWERFVDGAQAAPVDALVRAVQHLAAQAAHVHELERNVEQQCAALQTCAYTPEAIRAPLQVLQQHIDALPLAGLVNAAAWVRGLTARVDQVLLARLQEGLSAWAAQLDAPGALDVPVVHILPRAQALHLEPPLEAVQAHWFAALGACIDTVCALPQLHVAARAVDLRGRSVPTHAHLLAQVPPAVLQAPLRRIQAALEHVTAYVAQWRSLQVLWDVEPEAAVADVRGAHGWVPWLTQLPRVRAFLEGPPRRALGLVQVDAASAQARLAARWDAWQGAVHAECVRQLGEVARTTTAAMQAGRRELEPLSAVHASTEQVVTLVTHVAALTQAVRTWAPDVAAFVEAQAALVAQRVRLPPDWLHAEQMQSELSALQELLAHKQAAMDAQRENVQRRLASETRMLDSHADELLAAWTRDRPVSGHVSIDEALRLLDAYTARHAVLQAETQRLGEAREAVGLEAACGAADVLPRVADELASLRDVWGALSSVWAGVEELKSTPWHAVQVRSVRQRLEALVRDCRALPSRMRTYAAYEAVLGELQCLLQHLGLLSDLRSDAFQARHWRALHAQLGAPRYVAQQHTLGDVWALDWRANHTVIAAAVAVAQGEYALDVYLQQVREAWTTYALEWVDYRHECLLLKGFDAVCSLAAEHAGGLRAMAASPHYRVWEEEARLWEERVARIQTTFALWADVQRQWVYLHGVLGGRADMAHLLPVECARFQSISSEFLALLKKAAKAVHVLDVVNVAGVRPTLERLAELLHRLQTALSEYLERERARFPRFYLVGDDDLLAMLGLGSDVAAMQVHFKSMWAGLGRVHVEGRRMVRIETTAGELLDLKEPIEVRDGTPVHEWLQALEAALPRALAAALPRVLDALPDLAEATVESQARAPIDALVAWLQSAPAQLLVLACQITFVQRVEAVPWTHEGLVPLRDWLDTLLSALAEACSVEAVRARAEALVCLLTHSADVVAALPVRGRAAWAQELRHSLHGTSVQVRLAHATFEYGFELIEPRERLVQTPLTSAAYTTLLAALASGRGGAPFGPAGTGKTETVKALGAEVGRLVLVFNCDSQFDLRAMRRLLTGLGRLGAWGCFDEFNRLDEHVLSSVSQQVQMMQAALSSGSDTVRPTTGLFVTMNPAYAGRSRLPDNLVKLFRRVAMTEPDAAQIVQVLLRVHGFSNADALARKMVLLFRLCAEQLSAMPHYDFGLRALKAVLTRAGRLRRAAPALDEASVMAHSVQDTVAPRLVTADAPLLSELVRDVFPGVHAAPDADAALQEALIHEDPVWRAKLCQLHRVLQVSQGVVLMGPTGTGKTRAWRTLLEALARIDGRAGVAHVIEPKVLTKDALYGHLDPTTREWTDGLFTHILRRALEPREREKRHWIVWDGDLDPEWVETLNSVLDDNRQLTLPTGERLALPDHVRLLFEVDSVAYATRATITRCGMVWFAENDAQASWAQVLEAVRAMPVDEDLGSGAAAASAAPAQVAEAVAPYLAPDGVLAAVAAQAATLPHVMEPSAARSRATLAALLRSAVRQVQLYAVRHPDFPLSPADVRLYAQRAFVLALVGALAGDAPLDAHVALSDAVRLHMADELPGALGVSLLLYGVDAAPGAPWFAWASRVPTVEVDARALATGEVVVPTVDTVRYESLLQALLQDEQPVVLCGPPGSGKTMVLLAALRSLPDVDVVTLNLSSQTAPDTLLRTLEAHCQYEPNLGGQRLVPRAPGRRLVLFCDEINLPAPDKYGTPRVLALVRQLVAQQGFWRQRTWVTLERVQIVGACNPPTDAGRTPLPLRLLRHVPVVLVPYPSGAALEQIYTALARALLRRVPSLRGYAEALARGMVQYYEVTQAHFTPEQQAHYVYSPRELTRWVRGLHGLLPDDGVSLEELVRRWAHEAQRVFQDRLVTPADRAWSEAALDDVARAVFPGVDVARVLARPLLYSDWLSRTSERVARDALRSYAQARLRGFAEEALDTELVLHDAVLDLALACDRVLQQPAGHLLLVGVAGSGRTTVARFCAWLRGLTLYSLPSAKSYDEARFDDDLRALLRRVGVRGERVCWTLDESQVAAPSRVEKLNTLLANAEVSGLFEGDEYASLLSALREAAQREGLVVHADDELLAFFRAQIVAHLHVVLTMTPVRRDVAARAAAASPALLNRCTLVYCW